MKKGVKRFGKILIAAALFSLVLASFAFAESTATSITSIRFRTAVVTQIKDNGGIAQVTRGGDTINVYEGMRLFSSDKLTTQGKISVYVLIDQDKILRLDPDSEAVMKETFFGRRVKIVLKSGSMFFNAVEKLPENDSIQFVYGNITISVRGTSGLLKGVSGGTAFNMQLYDGKVEASETSNGTGSAEGTPGRTIKIEPGTQFQYASGSGEGDEGAVTEMSPMTLSDIPASVVEEMKNNEKLRDRILDSVPVTRDENGKQYADSNSVDLNAIGKPDAQAMRFSETIAKAAGIETQPGNGNTENSANTQNDENGTTQGNNDSTDYTRMWMFPCPGCKRWITPFEFWESHWMPCGHYRCCIDKEELELHTKGPCGEHWQCAEDFDEVSHEIDERCGCYGCSIDEDHADLHFALVNGCGHCLYEALQDWRAHIPAAVVGQPAYTYLCNVTGETMISCPLCDEKMTVTQFLASDHCMYNENHYLTCGGVRQSSNALVISIKGTMCEDLYAMALEYLGMEIEADLAEVMMSVQSSEAPDALSPDALKAPVISAEEEMPAEEISGDPVSEETPTEELPPEPQVPTVLNEEPAVE